MALLFQSHPEGIRVIYIQKNGKLVYFNVILRNAADFKSAEALAKVDEGSLTIAFSL